MNAKRTITPEQIKTAAQLSGTLWYYQRDTLIHPVETHVVKETNYSYQSDVASDIRINRDGKIKYRLWDPEKQKWTNKLIDIDRANRLLSRAVFS